MAGRSASRRHHRPERRRRICVWMGPDVRRPDHHHVRPRLSIQLGSFPTARKNLGDQDYYDRPLSSRGKRDGRKIPSQVEGGVDRPRSGRTASVVLASPMRHAGHKDDDKAGCQRVSSGPSIRRRPRGARGTSPQTSSSGRPTSSSTRVRARRPST